MEQDIKILEEIKESIDTDYGSGRRKVQAIDNLINRNKELEEENKQLLEIRISASANYRIKKNMIKQ